MLAVAGVAEIIIYTAAGILAAAILGISRAATKLYQSRQIKQREATQDLKTFSSFLFGEDKNPRTGTPAKEGWTSKVDMSLQILTAGQSRTDAAQVRIEHAINQVKTEVVDDNNGDHNLRGIVKRGAEAAGAEVIRQTGERTSQTDERVHAEDERVHAADERVLQEDERTRVQTRDADGNDNR